MEVDGVFEERAGEGGRSRSSSSKFVDQFKIYHVGYVEIGKKRASEISVVVLADLQRL